MGGWMDWEEVLRHLAGADVYFDTSFAVSGGKDDAPAPLLDRLLSAHSPDRLLFGTDCPWREQATELAALDAVRLPETTRNAILGGNATRLLDDGY